MIQQFAFRVIHLSNVFIQKSPAEVDRRGCFWVPIFSARMQKTEDRQG